MRKKERTNLDAKREEADNLSSGYVTIDERNANEEEFISPEDFPEKKSQILKAQSEFKDVLETKGLPYRKAFGELEDIVKHFEGTSTQRKSLNEEDLTSFYPIMKLEESGEFFLQLHQNKQVREYVDMLQSSELEDNVFKLIAKLKKLYYNRKVNPQKKGKLITRNQMLKKRYIIGLKETLKHLQAEALKLVIIAKNLERVEGEKGIDELIFEIIQRARDQKIPVIFSMTRYKLGLCSKYHGYAASIVGVLNFQGANDEYNELVKEGDKYKRQFYQTLAKSLNEY
eukprot:CAMPEP_0170543448 /NCGR_PEP_ID=MMETSP0211-20121228/2558_1 /TAXON_ID=311385 /ORGANISM="Pseudokeronopsis sp., Strain OXSARD2" /LENGTH=284 /DNA_ID=CAMNT_0010846825 /DNA_START=1204 /DNA_END=2058 /DNA_ORIENTATION=+